jgi:hypothetical protein
MEKYCDIPEITYKLKKKKEWHIQAEACYYLKGLVHKLEWKIL